MEQLKEFKESLIDFERRFKNLLPVAKRHKRGIKHAKAKAKRPNKITRQERRLDRVLAKSYLQ